MSLAQLIRGKRTPHRFATATPATIATATAETGVSVATVATVSVASSTCEVSDAATAEQWAELEEAINQCCNARGDTDAHRMALLADCLREHPSDWSWWTHYFAQESRH